MRVFIVGGSPSYRRMFNELGFTLSEDVYESDMLCFTGGADVNPELYEEGVHPLTNMHPQRDVEEIALYKFALNKRIPMVGICRGGQFLHVMNGGKLYQHVDKHAIGGTHRLFDVETQEVHKVTSTHHQMMRLNNNRDGVIVGTALESVHKEYVSNGGVVKTLATLPDIEAMWYKDTHCLCFQPHPEFEGAESTYLYFKNLLERYYSA